MLIDLKPSEHGHIDKALPVFALVFAVEPVWHSMIDRLVVSGDFPDDPAAISYFTSKFDADLTRLLERRASIGSKQQRMETVEQRISSEVIELKSLLSERIDLDYAESLVRFSTLQASFEAGLRTAGSFLQMSLIDFLE